MIVSDLEMSKSGSTPRAAPTAHSSIYTSLNSPEDEIRILELVSTKPQIVCKLSAISLSDRPCPAFSALSYEWGDPTLTRDIIVDGRPVAITVNLASALEYFLHHWKSQFHDRDPATCRLWADAICINQSDIDEKNKQVPLMRTVYETAELVVCWLGGPSPHWRIECGLFAMQKMSSVIPAYYQSFKTNPGAWDGSWDGTWIKSCNQLFWDDYLRDPFGNGYWEGIRQLLESTYWRRTWVIQECVLASSALVACGTKSLALKHLISIAEWGATVADGSPRPDNIGPFVWNMITHVCDWQLIRKLGAFKTHGLSIGEIMNPSLGWRRRLTTESWMYSTVGSSSLASDPRDHIYGLLALTKLPIVPDYSKPVVDVYRDYFERWLDWFQSQPQIDDPRDDVHMIKPLFPLFYSGITSCPELLSWVPNFAKMSRYQMAHIKPLSNNAEYLTESVFSRPCSSIHEEPLARIESNSLFIHALQLDHVSDNGVNLQVPIVASDIHRMTFDTITGYLRALIQDDHQSPSTNGYPQFLDAVAAMFSKPRYKSTLRCIPEAVQVLRLMVWDAAKPGDSRPAGRPVQAAISELGLRQAWEDAGLVPDENNIDAAEMLVGPLVNRILSSPNTKLVQTESGRNGVCPVQTTAGDVVCVLKGSALQHVFRKAPKKTHYFHVGTCWFPSLTRVEVQRLVDEGTTINRVVELR